MAKQIESSFFWVRTISLSSAATALIMSKSFMSTSVFVEHMCVSVEATIKGEDRFHWRLLNLGVESEVVGQ